MSLSELEVELEKLDNRISVLLEPDSEVVPKLTIILADELASYIETRKAETK
jgi:hypothetical protein